MFVLGVVLITFFIRSTSFIRERKVILNNKAMEVPEPPTPVPLYPPEYGVDFTQSNSTLQTVISTIKNAVKDTIFRKNSYIFSVPTTFRLGLFPRASTNTELKGYTYQTDLNNYPNMLKDEHIIRFFNPQYPKFHSASKYTQGLPVNNFCHLAALSNMVKSFGLEAVFVQKIKPLLSADVKDKNLTLSEIIFYRYYRVETPTKITYLASNTDELNGLLASVVTFEDIGQRMMDDINSIDPKKYNFTFENKTNLAGNSNVTPQQISVIESEIKKGNTLYIARAKLNGQRDLLTSFTYSTGPTHYLVITDAKNYFYPPVLPEIQAVSASKTAFFLIDSLGKIDYSTKTDASGYGGMGYIGWAGLYYFNGAQNKTYSVSTQSLNDMMNRASGIHDLIQIRNSIATPSTPSVPGTKKYQDMKEEQLERMQ